MNRATTLAALAEKYRLTDVRRDRNGTWWIGGPLRPDLLNMDSPEAALAYLDSLPPQMVANLLQDRNDIDRER